jgi:hypothetical protein
MATNDYNISDPNWGGQAPSSPTTGHFQAEAGSGMRANARKRAGLRQVERTAAFGQPTPGPLSGDEVQAFVDAYVANEMARRHSGARLAGGIIGAVVGSTIGKRMGRR